MKNLTIEQKNKRLWVIIRILCVFIVMLMMMFLYTSYNLKEVKKIQLSELKEIYKDSIADYQYNLEIVKQELSNRIAECENVKLKYFETQEDSIRHVFELKLIEIKEKNNYILKCYEEDILFKAKKQDIQIFYKKNGTIK